MASCLDEECPSCKGGYSNPHQFSDGQNSNTTVTFCSMRELGSVLLVFGLISLPVLGGDENTPPPAFSYTPTPNLQPVDSDPVLADQIMALGKEIGLLEDRSELTHCIQTRWNHAQENAARQWRTRRETLGNHSPLKEVDHQTRTKKMSTESIFNMEFGSMSRAETPKTGPAATKPSPNAGERSIPPPKRIDISPSPAPIPPHFHSGRKSLGILKPTPGQPSPWLRNKNCRRITICGS